MKKVRSLIVGLILTLLCIGASYYSTAIISLTVVGPVNDELSVSQTVRVWTENIYYWIMMLALVVLLILNVVNSFREKNLISYKAEKRASCIIGALLIAGTVVFSLVNQGCFFLIVLPVSLLPFAFLLEILYQEHKSKEKEYEGII